MSPCRKKKEDNTSTEKKAVMNRWGKNQWERAISSITSEKMCTKWEAGRQTPVITWVAAGEKEGGFVSTT